MIRRRAFGAHLLVAALAAVTLAAVPASAQSVSPSPQSGPSVEGQVTGALVAGSTLTIAIDASMPGGWEGLHLVEASVRSGGEELEHLRFEIEDGKLTIGDQGIKVGTGNVATGTYLRASGADVVVTTGGGNLSFEVNADVIEAIPEDARFVLSVTDDFGTLDEVSRGLAEPEGQGITWQTVLALIAAALFVGGFIGNLFASRLRPPARPSIYATVQRRLEQERTSGTSRP
ncbi:MAG TPA: hypothetical protein VJZ98_01520 [Actinomycetota bacterium]|nr:hypothetical protein [Actinomycetota bacterium]